MDVASLNTLAAQGGEVANVETSIAQIRNAAGPASKSLVPARAAFFAMTLPDAVDTIPAPRPAG